MGYVLHPSLPFPSLAARIHSHPIPFLPLGQLFIRSFIDRESRKKAMQQRLFVCSLQEQQSSGKTLFLFEEYVVGPCVLFTHRTEHQLPLPIRFWEDPRAGKWLHWSKKATRSVVKAILIVFAPKIVRLPLMSASFSVCGEFVITDEKL